MCQLETPETRGMAKTLISEYGMFYEQSLVQFLADYRYVL
jgi:hypothetical protein